ncbi:MAG: sigma 54-interacting transcriptional regulator [Desulfobacterales bacterium]|nr:sigma 54-interacting transcriptional regulator [Desulfobacterales bacterium]
MKAAKTAIAHKKLMDEKVRYKSNLEAVFSSVKDGLISVDKTLNIIDLNRSAERICGISRQDGQGQPFGTLELSCNCNCLSALEASIASQTSIEYPELVCGIGQKEQVVNVTATPLLDGQSNLKGGLLTVRDQTRLVSLERDMKRRRSYHNIVGKSEALQKIYSLIDTLADLKTTVLITGDSGTGKELIADALHFKSGHPERPMVKVNCGALSENLLESELFGHIKGAFSGAVQDRVGRFEMANGGTIFLDEVGEMSPGMQLRLLRVLQEQEFERVGDSSTIKVDVRIIAATNANLLQAVSGGSFRKDLYYRLKVLELPLPRLRDRKEDIPLLVDHFVEMFNREFGKDIHRLSEDAMKIFMGYEWPGNIRELKHAIEHGFILCSTQVIQMDHLPIEILSANDASPNPETRQGLLTALERARWNVTQAAKDLHMNRQQLYRKMKKHGISRC